MGPYDLTDKNQGSVTQSPMSVRDIPQSNYRPRSRGDNMFGGVRVFVCLSGFVRPTMCNIFIKGSITNQCVCL